MSTIQLSRPYSFKYDTKYEIPTALRKERRRIHANHPESCTHFRGMPNVLIGRPEDVDLQYEVPAIAKRVLYLEEPEEKRAGVRVLPYLWRHKYKILGAIVFALSAAFSYIVLGR